MNKDANRNRATSANKRVYDAHFIERDIIEFAPCRLPQKKMSCLEAANGTA